MILRGSVYSKTLEMETGITILTPRDRVPDRPAKVAYLLHGLSANNCCWTDYTLLPLYARDADVVFVMPEVGRSFYSDMKHGQRFFSYVADELPKLCRNTFNISPDRADTAIMGGSMGGYGALKIALSRPDRFGCACAFASACLYLGDRIDDIVRIGDMDVIREYLGDQLVRDFQAILGDSFAVENQHLILELARSVPEGNRPRIYSACGTEDDLVRENRHFRDDMLALGYEITYEEWPAAHDWFFFDAALRKGLEYWLGSM